MAHFHNALTSGRTLFFDGGTGTMLQARGLPPGESPEHFCLARPEVLKSVHADYIIAGADVITTCTFGGTRFKLPQGLEVESFNRTMAQVARSAAHEAEALVGRRVFVAGDMGPCGHFVKPLGELDPADLLHAFQEQVRGLVQGGVDLLLVETQFDLAEARLAVAAIRAETDLPVVVSMTFDQGASLTGTTPEILAATMRNMGVDAVGLNCGAGPDEMAPLVHRFLACAGIPVLVQPNAGLPELVDGETLFRLLPEPFAHKTAVFVEQGARLVGGCCGTTPAHIAALRKAVEAIAHRITPPSAAPGVVLTTRANLIHMGAGSPLRLIGERINPTGKKELQAQFQTGQCSLALRYAAEQIALGAPILDVNVGAPMVDETVLLPDLVQRLTGQCNEPLTLDSSNPEAIAAALPWCPGSSLVNSISGETGRMERLGPLCRQWGAPCILLPLQGKSLPVLASQRIAIIEDLLKQAENLGIPRHLIMVDVLALAVASKAEAAREGLETIRWCTNQGLPTVMGLSNISFGLPARELVNATFLAMAMGAGLSACIANPSSMRLNETRAAGDVLMGHDVGANHFVQTHAQWTSGLDASDAAGASSAIVASALPTTPEQAILLGDKAAVIPLLERELEAGADPFVMVRDRLIPAINEVGARYERREYFLPQLLRSAEAMQTAFARVKPLLEARSDAKARPVVVLATVEGDIHDIGKNIVGLLLGNHGFTVIDLGKDVKAEAIAEAALQHNAALVGLSALMTTTMVRMEETVTLIKQRGIDAQVFVGGAVVTQTFADRIGAQGYAADAVEAVRLAKTLTGGLS